MSIKHFFRKGPVEPKSGGRWASFKKLPWRTIWTWTLAIGLTAIVLGALGTTIAFAWYGRDLPDPNALLERQVAQSTKIFDRTGTVLLYEIHGDEKRTLVKIEDIPDTLKWATISVEDKAFYTHHGIYWQGLVRAFLKGILTGQKIKGTSTLTQQFVKNALLTNERSLARKIKEFVLAIQIERRYTKDQILQLYLNEIPYGSTMYGIESAAQGYFGKRAKDLTLDESALLAALPQAPDLYSPYGTGSRGDNRPALIARQHLILDLMAEQGYITKDAAAEAKKIDTLKKLIPKTSGEIKAPHFVTYVRSQLVDKYGQQTVEQGGLKVTTSLDWNLQQIGENAVATGVAALGTKYLFTNAALVSLDPRTGEIVAMVGSKDFYDQEHDGQVNVVLRPRQPGSSFKPIVYAAAFLKGFTPEMTLWDVNTVFKTDFKDYAPKNYDLKEHGPVSARMALQGSLNIPAVKMLYMVGVGRVLDFAEQLGYTTLSDRSRFSLSLVLGGGEVTLLEHAHAYAAFADEGKQAPIVSILKVEDAKGNTLEEWKPLDAPQLFDRNAALTISDVLSDNASRAYIFGARNYLTLPDRPVAVKTGTTNNNHDAWTMGYTPSLVTGVWVGNNNNDEMKHGADGSIVAAPIWQSFMKRAVASMPVEQFTKPAPTDTTKPELIGTAYKTTVNIDSVSGKLATEYTPPELIQQLPVYEAHNELWYIDKDDPRGASPYGQSSDPQFRNWESAVQDWVTRAQWHTTNTAPIGYDDIHVAGGQPVVTILAPTANATLTTRAVQISVSVSAPRHINRIEASIDGVLFGASTGDVNLFIATIPNNVQIGLHDLQVAAIDDLGNRGSTTISVNVLAEPTKVPTRISSPLTGAVMGAVAFPVAVTIDSSELAGAKKIDLYVQEKLTGDTQLVASLTSPQPDETVLSWSTTPAPGSYYLYPIITGSDGLPHQGEGVNVTITK